MTGSAEHAAGPVAGDQRITNLDTLRGFAVLGILVMNSISFVLPLGSYFRIDGPGTESPLDWVLAVFGEIIVDQKFMGLFSMLFGAGIALFADRVAAEGRDPLGVSLWRNAVLLAIGLAHSVLWGGDILVVYAICSPAVILLRGASPRLLLRLGTGLVVAPALFGGLANLTIEASGRGLGEIWLIDGDLSGPVSLFLLADYLCRALGMMLIGIVLHHNGVLGGAAQTSLYRRVAAVGLGTGWLLAAVGVIMATAGDFSPAVALPSMVPNTLGTIPASVGYVALVALWHRGSMAGGATARRRWLHRRLQAVGRMALTNYLSQTVLGVVVLASLVPEADRTRSIIAVFVVSVWLLQLAWSEPWLRHFRYGPVEWLWRCATYRRWLPLARD